jgi:hypothetical protein
MAGRTLEDLPLPPSRYRVDKHSRGFETLEDVRVEDALRAKQLRKAAAKHGGAWGKRARNLADRIDPALNPAISHTLASARYMRRLRIRVAGHLWRLVDQDKTGTVRRCDVVKAAWACDIADLLDETPGRLKNEFRSTLNRAGVPGATGFLFAALHGDFSHEREEFQPHYHLIVSGGMNGVVDGLRNKRGFRVSRSQRSTAPVSQPVRKSKGPLSDVPYAVTYLLKSYWPQRTADRRDPITGKKLRSRHTRIREPFHSTYLLWLDRFKLDDLIIKINMNIHKI